MRLKHPEAATIEQGAIFNCTVVPGYKSCKCWGIILTARCDLEHNKHSVTNYLPIVRFSDWLQRGVPNILSRRLRPALEKDIAHQLKIKGVSERLYAIFPLEDVIRQETKGSDQTNLLAKCANLRIVSSTASQVDGLCSEAKEVIRISGKQCDKLIEELIEQKLGEYYFLDCVDVYDRTKEGFVVLLRNMRAMDCELTNRIFAGLPKEKADPDLIKVSELTFEHEPICMVTGVLRSPDVEHLAQHFANLFVRIGLEDHALDTVSYHQQLSKSL